MVTQGFLTVKEAAKLMNVSTSAVHGMIKRNRIMCVIARGRYVIARTSIDKYMTTNSYKSGQTRKGAMQFATHNS